MKYLLFILMVGIFGCKSKPIRFFDLSDGKQWDTPLHYSVSDYQKAFDTIIADMKSKGWTIDSAGVIHEDTPGVVSISGRLPEAGKQSNDRWSRAVAKGLGAIEFNYGVAGSTVMAQAGDCPYHPVAGKDGWVYDDSGFNLEVAGSTIEETHWKVYNPYLADTLKPGDKVDSRYGRIEFYDDGPLHEIIYRVNTDTINHWDSGVLRYKTIWHCDTIWMKPPFQKQDSVIRFGGVY